MKLRDIMNNIPRERLAPLPTPLQRLQNTEKLISSENKMYIKRDDLTGIGSGGNKVRCMEYIIGRAKADGCVGVLASGNGQSNLWSVTGTYEGSGGSSKNVQVLQSTSRTNSSSLTKVLGDLTVSKTGTYDVYWSGGRSNTSTSYTWGTRLYVDGSGYGTENTTWTNNCQSNHLSNVSLTANQKLSVYARGRTGSYYTFAPMLVIIEA